MIAIGFRAEPKQVFWAVIDGPEEPVRLVASGKLSPAGTFSEAASLAWYRSEIKNFITKFDPVWAAVRYPESNARSKSLERARVEGVLLEVCHREGRTIFTGGHARMTSKLGKSSKDYLQAGSFRGLEWSHLPERVKEAIEVAEAALEQK
jgi:hypothetical protein